MPEYYLIILTRPELKTIRRLLRDLYKHDGIFIDNIMFSIVITKWNRQTQGVLGGIKNISDNIFLMRGYIPFFTKP